MKITTKIACLFRLIGVTTKLYVHEDWNRGGYKNERFPKPGWYLDGSDVGVYTWRPRETMEVILNLDVGVISFWKVTQSLELVKVKQNYLFGELGSGWRKKNVSFCVSNQCCYEMRRVSIDCTDYHK